MMPQEKSVTMKEKPIGSSEETEAAPAEGAASEKPEKRPSAPDKARRNALIRAGLALLAAALLLVLTKFSVIDLIKGPRESSAIQQEQTGAFVKRDIMAILGYYADSSSGVSGKYAIVPMGSQFVSVHFTSRYLSSAGTIEADTIKYISGDISTLDKYVTVQGTVGKLSEGLSGEMYDWLSENKAWMVKGGIIPSADDYSKYISDAVLEVDTVGSLNQNLVVALSAFAALCLVYMLLELILIASRFYRGKAAVKAQAGAREASAESAIESGAHGEAPECIKTAENAENGSASAEIGAEGSDVSEEKK